MERARVFTRVRFGRLLLLRATKCCILQGFLVFTCKSSNFQAGNLGGKLLVISRISTIQKMAMCCGPSTSTSSHGCHARGHGLGMDALVSVCSGNTHNIWFGHGCFGQCMLWEHERYYGLGMDALVSVCSGNMNVILFWAWMLWSAYAL